MIFVEFMEEKEGRRYRHYFVGEALEAVLKDTARGTNFGWSKFCSHREVTEGEVRAQRPDDVDSGMDAVRGDRSKSYYLGERSDQ